jgi:hypothetical protein
MEHKRDERVGLVLTAEEKAALRDLAEAQGGLSQAAVIRQLLRSEAQKHGLWPRPCRLLPQRSAEAQP